MLGHPRVFDALPNLPCLLSRVAHTRPSANAWIDCDRLRCSRPAMTRPWSVLNGQQPAGKQWVLAVRRCQRGSQLHSRARLLALRRSSSSGSSRMAVEAVAAQLPRAGTSRTCLEASKQWQSSSSSGWS